MGLARTDVSRRKKLNLSEATENAPALCSDTSPFPASPVRGTFPDPSTFKSGEYRDRIAVRNERRWLQGLT
jgi:hypothetical protein